jgi:hypothetical protein
VRLQPAGIIINLALQSVQHSLLSVGTLSYAVGMLGKSLAPVGDARHAHAIEGACLFLGRRPTLRTYGNAYCEQQLLNNALTITR